MRHHSHGVEEKRVGRWGAGRRWWRLHSHGAGCGGLLMGLRGDCPGRGSWSSRCVDARRGSCREGWCPCNPTSTGVAGRMPRARRSCS